MLHKIGINRAVGYGLLTQVWGLVAGLVTMVMIARFFTGELQGYYYTFSSLLALQIFFELGLTGVIATFASHEFAKLSWGESGAIVGDPLAQKRLSELIAKTTHWFGVASLLLCAVLIPIGLVFFSLKEGRSVDFGWRLPWVLAVVGVAINLYVTPCFALITGSGDVEAVNYRQFAGMVTGFLLSWVVMGAGGGLYAVCSVSFGKAVISWYYLVRYKPELLKLAHKRQASSASDCNGATLSWRRELWPMQWKIALSWMSGYFIYQLFTPVLFHYHGAIVAGKMGLTLSASNALLGASITLFNTKSPELGKLVAVRDWRSLDAAFSKVFWQALAFSVCGGIAGWGGISLLQVFHPIGQRFLPSGQVAVLLATVSIQTVIFGLAMYLRSHKQDPFMVVSIVGAVIQGGVTWYFGKYYSSVGVTFGFLMVSLLFGLPASWYVWRRFRREWHAIGSAA